MMALARLAVAHPWRVLAGWLAVVGALALLGLGVEDRLHRSSLEIPGTASDRAGDAARAHFGDVSSMVILLKGPPAALDRQGPDLARVLERRDSLIVLAPWVRGGGDALRPAPDEALLLVRSTLPFEQVSREIVPAVRDELERRIEPPVAVHLSGYPDIAAGIHGNSVEAIRRAELIAAPALLIVLLLVFRSPLAAALPLAIGLTTIGAGSGFLELANRWTGLDAIALNLMSMMGLALGVDYSLLLVSRFREELARQPDQVTAARVAVGTAGRTIVFAGAALAAAMIAAYVVSPGALLTSASFGVVVAVVLGAVGALSALPAMLAILGPGIDRWRFGDPHAGDSRLGGLALRALRRPAVAAAMVAGLVAVLAAPALAIETGPPDPRVLPDTARERADFEAIRDALGAGWTAPYEIVLAAEQGPITDPNRLAAIDRWQERIAQRDDVRAVLGAGTLADRTRRFEEVPRQLARADDAIARGLRDQERFRRGLDRAGSGTADLRAGLGRGARGAGRLETGAERGAAGTARIDDGLGQARRGSDRLRGGLGRAVRGSRRLAAGATRGARGARRLESGIARARAGVARSRPQVGRLTAGLRRGSADLDQLREPAGIAERELAQALEALDRMAPTSKADPEYRRLYESVATASGAVSGRHPRTGKRVRRGYDGIDAELAGAVQRARRAAAGSARLETGLGRLQRGLGRLEGGAERLQRGGARLDVGATRLRRGIGRLAAGSRALLSGLTRLESGAGRLAGGVERLEGGTGELERGLAAGAERTGRLKRGLGRMEEVVATASDRTRRLSRSLEGSDRLGDAIGSGYFVLSALDSLRPGVRRSATFAVNLERGGSAARIAVIGRGSQVVRKGDPLRAELERELDGLERKTNSVATIGGPAPILQDFDSETSGRFWLLVAVIAGVTYLILVPVLRSLLLPLLAVLLNLLTVAAAFGVLVVLFQGDAPLGGPGYLDAIMVGGIFSVVFGLSIDYEVFLLARMREGYALEGTTDGAIAYGLRRTAGVITGAALIMTGVFVAFALADIASMRQLGIGLTVAVLLDATVIRLVLLPAAIRLCGEASWWLPGWLDRLLGPAAIAPPPAVSAEAA